MDQNLLERVNPVFNTAKMTVFQLAAAGVEDAARVAEKLNLTYGEKEAAFSPYLAALRQEMRRDTEAMIEDARARGVTPGDSDLSG